MLSHKNTRLACWQLRQLTLAVLICVALVVAGCGGGDDDDSGSAPTGATETTAAVPTTTEGNLANPDVELQEIDQGTVDVATSDCPKHVDPRGGIFQEHQNEFDRCHPFQSLDTFCVAHDAPGDSGAPAEPRVATDPGITADSISLVHIRTKSEELAALGFAINIGDPAGMYNTFAWFVNNMCGGVNGRTIEVELVEVAASGANIDELRNAACVEATEDHNAVVVMNSSGFQGTANLCLVEDHQTAFVSTQGQSGEFMQRGEGRLISLAPTLEESLAFLVQTLIAGGELAGKTIGVVAADTPGQPESVERGLVDPLREAGLDVAVFDVIGCGGQVTCTEGTPDSVSRLLDEGVDVLFPTLNVVSLPQYLGEMVDQGFEPGDVTFYNSNFNSQANNTVSSKIVAFGGEAAGRLYDGAIIIDGGDPAGYHEPGWEPRQFNQMCNRIYETHVGEVEINEGLSQPPHDPYDPSTNPAYSMVTGVCAQMRLVMRAIYDAGPNPTRQDIYGALANLGAIDFNNMLVNSIRPGKPQTLDTVHTLMFTYPCASGEEFGFQPQGTCIVNAPGDRWLRVQR